MPASFTISQDGGRDFILSPNASLSRPVARGVLGVTAAVTGVIALYFTSQGMWPVLPFAGLEIAVLAWALRSSMQSSLRRDHIHVDAATVCIESRTAQGIERREFARHWAKVALRPARHTRHSTRLMIESRGRACEVGCFLTEAERRDVARQLGTVVGRINESPVL